MILVTIIVVVVAFLFCCEFLLAVQHHFVCILRSQNNFYLSKMHFTWVNCIYADKCMQQTNAFTSVKEKRMAGDSGEGKNLVQWSS